MASWALRASSRTVGQDLITGGELLGLGAGQVDARHYRIVAYATRMVTSPAGRSVLANASTAVVI
jgi:hypothetical protein